MTFIDYRGIRYNGKTLDTIAHRIWGNRTYVRVSPDPNSVYGDRVQAQVLRDDRYGTNVVAAVLVPMETGQ